MSDRFSLTNSHVLVWLLLALSLAIAVALALPPALWLAIIGGVLVAICLIANSARTGQWMSWENEGSLNLFEGCAGATGLIFVLIPILTMIGRSWLW